ncbi:S8 family serine peptidase [Massilia pinisoli]|uniref:S8 family serine peptidase n=1 Tax=Massilia pinisoli TaxID=1772194 RepID=A0ABT1ZTQ1_9BURK|nr:S8 family serine peptidase [Massilia pinisoli]MCS0583254.1 S8 family serine peptidase [Massilia pinisoli]
MKFPYVKMRAAAAAVLLGAAASAHAQLGLPSLPLPGRIGPVGLDGLRRPVDRLLDRAPLPDLGSLRLDTVKQLLRNHPDQLEADPRGEPALRGEVLAWSPSEAALQAARDAGATVVSDDVLPGLGDRMVVLRLPAGASTAAMVEQLRAIDPDGSYDFNHVYTGSGAAGGVRAGDGPAVRVGLVDSGVDGDHPVFEDAAITRWGCNGQAVPAPHGTAVAALMVGRSEHLHGAAPGASLYAADVYCGSPVGGAADRIAAALGWLDQQAVGVVNISLVGPSNALLARAVAAMQAHGHLLVAAVGNDGPAAPPLYPASYPGVVGVTGVDRRGKPLPEAARGPQVKFAAPGSQMVSAAPGTPPYRQVRGTSFAAPIVAALLAQRLPRPDRAAAARAVDALAREAGHGQAVANDEVGYGIVGAAVRTDPADLR